MLFAPVTNSLTKTTLLRLAEASSLGAEMGKDGTVLYIVRRPG